MDGALAYALKQGPSVEGPLAQASHPGPDELVGVHVRITLGDLSRAEHLDFGTHGELPVGLRFESFVGRFVIGDEHVARAAEVDVRRLPIDLHVGMEVGDELHPELAQRDVQFTGELCPNAVLGASRVGPAVGPIRLDHQHRAVEVGIFRQEVRRGAPDHRPADADDVVAGREIGHQRHHITSGG